VNFGYVPKRELKGVSETDSKNWAYDYADCSQQISLEGEALHEHVLVLDFIDNYRKPVASQSAHRHALLSQFLMTNAPLDLPRLLREQWGLLLPKT
jgi:hypothetical protein